MHNLFCSELPSASASQGVKLHFEVRLWKT